MLTVRTVSARNWTHGFRIGLSTLFIVLLAADVVDGPLSNSDSLRRFASGVDARTSDADRVFFFRERLPAVALYTERSIATFRKPRDEPQAPFFLIVRESLTAKLPDRWRTAGETAAADDARVFARRRMGIRLIRIP
jgi:hypothetical protein